MTKRALEVVQERRPVSLVECTGLSIDPVRMLEKEKTISKQFSLSEMKWGFRRQRTQKERLSHLLEEIGQLGIHVKWTQGG